MKPLKANEIFGNWATLLLPINNDGSINYRDLENEIDVLISCKVNGIYSNGTAGEFYNQTEEEFLNINQILAEKCNVSGMPFQIGCSHMSPEISLQRIRKIKALNPSAIQIILPDWFVPTDAEVIDFLKVMSAEAAPIGLILYNPPHAKKKLAPEHFKMILKSDIPLLGCKVAGGDERWYQLMREFPANFSVFIPGHHLATGIAMGAHGAYSNVACLNPLFAQQWFESMRNEPARAMEVQDRIQYFMNTCIVPYITEQGYSNQAVDKFMAAVGGWTTISPRLRWPYRSIPESDILVVRDKCAKILPEVFQSLSG